MLLSLVTDNFKVVSDSKVDNAFNVHKNDGKMQRRAF